MAKKSTIIITFWVKFYEKNGSFDITIRYKAKNAQIHHSIFVRIAHMA